MIETGDQAPSLALTDDRGNAWDLADFGGRSVVLIFHRHFY